MRQKHGYRQPGNERLLRVQSDEGHQTAFVLGHPYFVHCTKASLSDDEGFLTRIRENKQELLEWPVGQGVTRRLKHG